MKACDYVRCLASKTADVLNPSVVFLDEDPTGHDGRTRKVRIDLSFGKRITYRIHHRRIGIWRDLKPC